MTKTTEKYICCHCGEELNSSEFYKSDSKFYHNSKLPICKDCFIREFGNYLNIYHSSKKAMQRMCMAFDVYFEEDLFDSCDNSNDERVIGNYFRKLNMNQHKGKTFDATIEKGDILLSGDRKPVKEKKAAVIDEYGNEIDGEINQKDLDRWGTGFDPIDYDILNQHYNYLKKANPNCDGNQEIFIVDLCYTNMQKMKALRESRVDDYNKLTESYRKSFNQAGLKTTSESKASADESWSTFTGIISQYTPEEYYKNKKRYRDFDGLGEYYDRMVGRPIENIITGSTDRDSEYYVHDDDGEDLDG